MIIFYWVSYLIVSETIGLPASHHLNQRVPEHKDIFEIIHYIIILLMVSISEEVAKALFLKGLGRSVSFWASIVWCSVLFGIAHCPSLLPFTIIFH